MGRDFYKEKVMKVYPCRCGGETRITFQVVTTDGVMIKDVPVLVCQKCGEEWYPPGIPRMLEGLKEASKNLGRIEVVAELL